MPRFDQTHVALTSAGYAIDGKVRNRLGWLTRRTQPHPRPSFGLQDHVSVYAPHKEGPIIIINLRRIAVPENRPPYPPFTRETALQKVQGAEDAWNTCDPHQVALAYTPDSMWRNRSTFVNGRTEIITFLTQKWERELDYALRKSLWGFSDNRIAVRFQYECHDTAGQWWRSYGNELWEFDEHGLMRRREASINDVAIAEASRRIHGPRPSSEHGIDIPLE
jgi:nuclear transport factor 2 (NTF2) superfamily protein